MATCKARPALVLRRHNRPLISHAPCMLRFVWPPSLNIPFLLFVCKHFSFSYPETLFSTRNHFVLIIHTSFRSGNHPRLFSHQVHGNHSARPQLGSTPLVTSPHKRSSFDITTEVILLIPCDDRLSVLRTMVPLAVGHEPLT